VDNAYVKINKVFDRVDLTMGRQFYGDPEDINIYFGPNNDDLLSVNSVDLFRATGDVMGLVKLEGIAGKTAEGTAVAATNPGAPSNVNSDTDLWGVKVMTDKLIPMGSMAASYYTLKAKGAGAAANNTLGVLTVTARGDIPMVGGLGYRADFLQDFGANDAVAGAPGYEGTAYFANLHYGRGVRNMPFRAQVEYGHGTDTFLGISPGRRFGIIWGEHSNVGPSTVLSNGPGLTNLQVLDAGVGISPIAKLGIDFNAYRFDHHRGVAGRTHAGNEYDLIVSWKHSDNVSLEANAALFDVGDALQNTAPTPTDNVRRLGADVKMKF